MKSIQYPHFSHSFSLSLSSIRALAENGYRPNFTNQKVQFRKKYDCIGPFIVFFLFGFIALPLFDFYYWLGVGVFVSLVLGVFVHYQVFSGKATINIDAKNHNIEIKNRFGDIHVPFDEVSGVFVNSKYKGSFAHVNKGTSEEYNVTVGLELDNQKRHGLFHYRSDQFQPSNEVMEMHDYLKSLLRP